MEYVHEELIEQIMATEDNLRWFIGHHTMMQGYRVCLNLDVPDVHKEYHRLLNEKQRAWESYLEALRRDLEC